MLNNRGVKIKRDNEKGASGKAPFKKLRDSTTN